MHYGLTNLPYPTHGDSAEGTLENLTRQGAHTPTPLHGDSAEAYRTTESHVQSWTTVQKHSYTSGRIILLVQVVQLTRIQQYPESRSKGDWRRDRTSDHSSINCVYAATVVGRRRQDWVADYRLTSTINAVVAS